MGRMDLFCRRDITKQINGKEVAIMLIEEYKSTKTIVIKYNNAFVDLSNH